MTLETANSIADEMISRAKTREERLLARFARRFEQALEAATAHDKKIAEEKAAAEEARFQNVLATTPRTVRRPATLAEILGTGAIAN
jgi:hypothetical protein